MNQQIQSNKKVIVARLGAPFGIKGWLHLVSYTKPIDNIFTYSHWQIQIQKQYCPIQCIAHKFHGKSFIVKLSNCDDRNKADLLKNSNIFIDREDLPDTAQGEYYWVDLIGLSVITTHGKNLGIVDYLFETGSNDVIVTKNDEKQLFIPYTNAVIKNVDLIKRVVIIDWEVE